MNQKRDQAVETGEASLMRYIWAHTKRQQLWIFVVVLLSLPTYFLVLDLPKQIINGPIQGVGFATAEATQRLFHISFAAPSWIAASGRLTLFSGIELTRSGVLVALSLLFLLLVIVNGLFKLYINIFKGKLGERMLRRLRYELIDRVLRFPFARFKRLKAPEVATMVKDEIEPLGNFIGDAYVQPIYLGGQAITAMIFILVQDLWLGLMAGGIVLVQALVIPKLRRRLIVLGRERQLTARELAGRVGEIVDGIGTIRLNDLTHYERADISARLGRIYWIRFDIYQWKFLVKFLNNFLSQVTPFLFYLIGGYLVLKGRLDIGQLVAVIAAYRELPPPVKELIDWDQQRIDAQVKYAQVMQQFEDELLDVSLQRPAMETAPSPAEPITVNNLAVVDESGARVIERASLTLAPHESVAVVAQHSSESEALADALVRLVTPSNGRVALGKLNLSELSEATLGRRLAYASADSFLPQASVRDTLLYVLKRAPVNPQPGDAAQRKLQERQLAEARRSGNTELDVRADWIDYAAAGVKNETELLDRIRGVTHIAGLSEEILNFGLRGFIDPERAPERAKAIVAAREALRERLSAPELSDLVEVFDAARYNSHATVAENLLFGTAVGPAFADANLAGNNYIRSVLAKNGLDAALFEMGREIAGTTVEMFEDLPPDHPFFEELSFMRPEQVQDYKAILQSIQGKAIDAIAPEERQAIVRLSFAYVEPRHRMGLLNDVLVQRLVEGRRLIHDGLPAQHRSAIEFHDRERYNKAATLQDNITFGRIAHGIAGGPERVLAMIRDLLRELALEDLVFDAGLEFNVGHGGARLSAAQRQRIAVARALIKRPDYAIFKHPLSALNVAAQSQVMRAVLECARDPAHPFAVIWVTPAAELAHMFDKVAVFDRGALAEFGPPSELKAADGAFSKLLG